MSFVYPFGIRKLLLDGNWQTDVFKALLVKGTSTYSPSPDHKYVSDLGNSFELALNGYSRILVTNKAINLPLNSRILYLTCNSLNFGAIQTTPPGQDLSVKAVIVYRRVGPDDSTPADDELLLYYDGKTRIKLAAPARPGDNTIYVDPLLFTMAPGTVLQLTDGANYATCTVESYNSPGTRALSLSNPVQGQTISEGGYSNDIDIANPGGKFPFTIGGGVISINVPDTGIIRVVSV